MTPVDAERRGRSQKAVAEDRKQEQELVEEDEAEDEDEDEAGGTSKKRFTVTKASPYTMETTLKVCIHSIAHRFTCIWQKGTERGTQNAPRGERRRRCCCSCCYVTKNVIMMYNLPTYLLIPNSPNQSTRNSSHPGSSSERQLRFASTGTPNADAKAHSHSHSHPPHSCQRIHNTHPGPRTPSKYMYIHPPYQQTYTAGHPCNVFNRAVNHDTLDSYSTISRCRCRCPAYN